MFPQRLYPISFGCMMAAGQISHPAFAREMHGRLRNLPTDIGARAGSDRFTQQALRGARAPCDTTQWLDAVANHQRCSAQPVLDPAPQFANGIHPCSAAQPSQVVFAKAPVVPKAETRRQLGVVAERGVHVQRQVVGEQVQVVFDQQLQPLMFLTDHAHVLAAPEITVMHQEGIGAVFDRRLQQRTTGRHASDDMPDMPAPLDLEPVWAIILKTGNIKRLRQIIGELISIDRFSTHSIPFMRRLWLLFAQTVTVSLAILFIVTTLKPEWAAGVFGGGKVRTSATAVPMMEAPPNNAPVASSFRGAAKVAMPSVVNVFTSKKTPQSQNPFLDDPFFRKFFGDRMDEGEEKQISLGSGVIVSSKGYILTNNHVVEAADEIEVALADGRKASAKVVGADPETDLAVIKVDLENLPAITLGRVEDARVGDVVLAIGNPFGVGQTVTMGIISALGRNHLGILDAFENFIQTDAAINPGNSGGALIDANGNLLGINTAIYSRSGGSLGIGFAIPVTTVKSVMDAIIRDGQVIRGYIGVEPQDITPELAESFGLKKSNGAIIAGVLKGGPADKAGIRPGDILVSVNDKAVVNMSDMLNDIAQLKPGSAAKIVVLRNNQENAFTVTVGKRPKAQPRPAEEQD